MACTVSGGATGPGSMTDPVDQRRRDSEGQHRRRRQDGGTCGERADAVRDAGPRGRWCNLGQVRQRRGYDRQADAAGLDQLRLHLARGGVATFGVGSVARFDHADQAVRQTIGARVMQPHAAVFAVGDAQFVERAGAESG